VGCARQPTTWLSYFCTFFGRYFSTFWWGRKVAAWQQRAHAGIPLTSFVADGNRHLYRMWPHIFLLSNTETFFLYLFSFWPPVTTCCSTFIQHYKQARCWTKKTSDALLAVWIGVCCPPGEVTMDHVALLWGVNPRWPINMCWKRRSLLFQS
jgi:hypothetical protein